MQIDKYILLNAGGTTRKGFMEGLPNARYESYRSKELLLHVAENGDIFFVHKNTPVDFKNAYVFTRLRATDAHFCGMLYEYFAHVGIPASDPINRSFPYSAEKITQMLLLPLNNIRIPETLVFREESYETNREYVSTHMHFPIVFKTDGSKGRNVHVVHTQDELDEIMKRKRPFKLALVQPFIENTYDTRTLVAYGEILGSIKRTRTQGYLNNIAQGAVPSLHTLTDIERDTAIRATSVCGMDFAGVDMIHTPKGPIVLEVNKSPQVHGFESVHNFKVFKKIAELIGEKF